MCLLAVPPDRSYEDLFKDEIARRGLGGGSVTSSREDAGAGPQGGKERLQALGRQWACTRSVLQVLVGGWVDAGGGSALDKH